MANTHAHSSPLVKFEPLTSTEARIYKKPGYRLANDPLACFDADEKGEALKYITKLADHRERAENFFRELEKRRNLVYQTFSTMQKHVRCWKDRLSSSRNHGFLRTSNSRFTSLPSFP